MAAAPSERPCAHTPMLDKESLQKKVASYERFLYDVLKRDLKGAEAKLEGHQHKLRQLDDLERLLLKEAATGSLEKDVDVGGGVLCRVRVPDTNVMYVEVGSGFHVETHGREEVRRLLALQRQAAARRVQQAREVTSELQGQVDYVEASLEQLLKSMKHDYDDS